MKIRFTEVGRDRVTFEAEVPHIDERSLTQALRSGARVMSREIEFGLDKDTLSRGYVFAGERAIGRWEVTEP